MNRARFLQQGPDKQPKPGTHRAVNFVIFLTIISLGAWVIYGGTWVQMLLATASIAVLATAWVLADRLQYKRRIRRMREEADARRASADIGSQTSDVRFKRGPFDFHGES